MIIFPLEARRLAEGTRRGRQAAKRQERTPSAPALPRDKAKCQSTYIDAISTLAGTSIYFGKYQTSPHTCRNCGHVHNASSEKMTDVNIAVELLQDAFQDAFDVSILISADSDLIGPIGFMLRRPASWK